MLALKFLLIFVVAIVVVFFLVINSHTVDINFYNLNFEFKTIGLPFSILIVVSTFVGFATAWIFGLFEKFKLKGKIRKQSKELKTMKKNEMAMETEKLSNVESL